MQITKELLCPATLIYLTLKYGPGIVLPWPFGICSLSELPVYELGPIMVATEKANQ